MRKILRCSLVTLFCALTFIPAKAQPVIKFFNGSTPGVSLDMIARMLAERMGRVMGKQIVVENRPGASYTLAAAQVAKAEPDGNTALVTFSVHPTSGALYPKLPYDPVKDFRSVGVIAKSSFVVVATPTVPGANLKELIESAKARKRPLSFASVGLGSPSHLIVERIKQQTGADIQVVHYKSSNAAHVDVAGGHADFLLSTVPASEGLVKSGKLKVMAVASEARLPAFPNAPTMDELGYKGLADDIWYALLVPAKTPDRIVNDYNKVLNQILQEPEAQNMLKGVGFVPAKPNAPHALDAQMVREAAVWKQLVQDLNIKAE